MKGLVKNTVRVTNLFKVRYLLFSSVRVRTDVALATDLIQSVWRYDVDQFVVASTAPTHRIRSPFWSKPHGHLLMGDTNVPHSDCRL